MAGKPCGKDKVTVKGADEKSEGIAVTNTILLPKGIIYNGGDDSREDPPVPIPNTEVKLSYADGTASRGRVGSCRLSLLLSSVGRARGC